MSKYAVTTGIQTAPVKTVLYGPEASANPPLHPIFRILFSSTPRAAPNG